MTFMLVCGGVLLFAEAIAISLILRHMLELQSRLNLHDQRFELQFQRLNAANKAIDMLASVHADEAQNRGSLLQ